MLDGSPKPPLLTNTLMPPRAPADSSVVAVEISSVVTHNGPGPVSPLPSAVKLSVEIVFSVPSTFASGIKRVQ